MMRIAFYALLVSAPLAGRADVLLGPISNEANGHIYYLLTANSWSGSEAEAVSLGGHLVTINDAAENAWVNQHFGQYIWIGLLKTGDSWSWISGEPFTFSNWNSGEPNNYGGIENRGEMLSFNGMWNDAADDVCGLEPWLCPIYGVVEVPCSQANAPLTAVCQSFAASLDANGSITVNAIDIDGGSTSPCGITARLIDGVPAKTYACADQGNHTVTLTVFDAAGHSSSCTTNVTVQDTTPPKAACRNFTALLDSTGLVTVRASDIDGGSTDNCSIIVRLIDGAPSRTYSCADLVGRTAELTVQDSAGNTASCLAVVSVVASLQPVMKYSGDTNGVVGSKATLKATLKTAPNGLSFVGFPITFTVGSQSVTAVTDRKGTATAMLVLNQPAGKYMVTAASGGLCPYESISVSTPFTIKSSKK